MCIYCSLLHYFYTAIKLNTNYYYTLYKYTLVLIPPRIITLLSKCLWIKKQLWLGVIFWIKLIIFSSWCLVFHQFFLYLIFLSLTLYLPLLTPNSQFYFKEVILIIISKLCFFSDTFVASLIFSVIRNILFTSSILFVTKQVCMHTTHFSLFWN